MQKIIISTALIILTSLALIDRARFNNGMDTIFTRDAGGCECQVYDGIGYSVIYYFPETPLEDTKEYPPTWRWFWEE
jgi:hypothetical protein